jgi:hypothetical protein
MYRIYQFGSTPLPPAMTEDDLSTGEVESTLAESVGNLYDVWGVARRLSRSQKITVRGMYEISDSGRFDDNRTIYLIDHLGRFVVDHAGRNIIADYAALALRRNVDALKAQEGTRQRLYRRREDDGMVSWMLARLLRVGYLRTIDDAGVVAPIEAIFETAQAAWRANSTSTYSAALPAGLAIQNGGDVAVNDAVLTVAATGAISWVAIKGPGVDLLWTGSLGAGQSLVIDAGAQTVRAGGADRYSGLARGAGHTAAGWLPVAVGASSYMINADGAGTATLTFNEQQL